MIQPLRKVELAIRGFKDCRLDDLAMMGVCSHTGCNENVNSVHNKVRTDTTVVFFIYFSSRLNTFFFFLSMPRRRPSLDTRAMW
jgi:hypothetical protein